MLFMLSWSIPPDAYKDTIETFLTTGAPVPEGVTTVGRWHVPGSAVGWHLVEGDAAAVAGHVAAWAGLVELDVAAVIDDEAAASGLSKAFGK